MSAAGAQNLAEALAEGKSLADFLSLCEFKNANGYAWSVGTEGGKHLASAVAAFIESDAVVARAIKAARQADGSADPCDFPACGCTGKPIIVRAALRAAVREGGERE